MSTAPLAASPRISWDDVPRRVRAEVEQGLGSAITSAVTQHGGFSPGEAVRVACEDGRRAFVKAVGLSLNPDSPGLHRTEIHAMSVLPDEVPAPRLLASYDDGDWVALVLEDVDGRRPDVPWLRADVDAMSVALGHLARTTAPEQLPPYADVVNMLTGWDKVTANPAGMCARRPPPPGLPTIRTWQAHCRDHALRWIDDGALWN
jgi:hypothetical protein